MNNYKVLFSLRLLKSVLDTFVDTFFVMYFLDVSSDNIVPLGIYHIILVLTIYLTIYACRNFTHSKHRVSLIRIAMVMDVLYFFAILLLQTRVASFAWLLGILRGLEEGFYYAVYNIMESDGIKNKERAKYIGSYKAASAAFAVIFPITLGAVIQMNGFANGVIAVLIVVSARLGLSFMYKDQNLPRSKKTDLKKFRETVKRDRRFRWLNIMHIFDGITSSSSALSYVFTIYVMKVFSDSFSLGVATAIFSVTSGIIGVMFAKFIHSKHYTWCTSVTMSITIVTMILMIFECNPVTIILFRFWRGASKDITHNINERYASNLSNDEKVKRRFKTEFWVNNEGYLVTGRVISGLLLISLSFMEDWTFMMLVFAVLIGVWGYTSVRYQQVTRRHERKKAANALRPAYDYSAVSKK